MSNESRKSSKRSTKRTPGKPREPKSEFDPKLLARSRKIAEQYSILLEPHERLGFFTTSIEMPSVFADGRTVDACIANIQEALTVAVAVMLQHGDAPPAPASERRRNAQVNIRLTAEEKLLLEQAAKQRGFRGVSDFVRNLAMSQLRRSA